MKQRHTDSTRELGLDLSHLFARHLFKTDHLHFGYWPESLPVEASNLKCAQENYVELLLQNIPAGAHTILDVGSGTGALASRLIQKGYQVDCVSPSITQTERVRSLLAEEVGEAARDTCQIFECRYEDLETEKRYDVVLFSESFQYIKLERALTLSCELLRVGGHLLICDFFRNETPDKGPFGGGHRLAEFQTQIRTLPFEPRTDLDITDRMAPNIDLTARFHAEVFAPAKERVFRYLEQRYHLPFQVVKWIFRDKLRTADEKYMKGDRHGANFKIYKTYRLLMFQHCPAG